MLSEERLAILERFGDNDTQEIIAELRKAKELADYWVGKAYENGRRAEAAEQQLATFRAQQP